MAKFSLQPSSGSRWLIAPTIHHIVIMGYPVWPKTPRYTKTLLSCRIFQGLIEIIIPGVEGAKIKPPPPTPPPWIKLIFHCILILHKVVWTVQPLLEWCVCANTMTILDSTILNYTECLPADKLFLLAMALPHLHFWRAVVLFKMLWVRRHFDSFLFLSANEDFCCSTVGMYYSEDSSPSLFFCRLIINVDSC